MNIRQAAAKLQSFFSVLVPETRRELTVVTPETLGLPFLLHISKDTELGRFVPGVTRRGLKREDRTVPRVSTAPSLLGCLIAYASDMFDFHERKPGAKFSEPRNVPFKGGYAIYGFRYDIALRPSRKLVPDVEQSDEHWLVAYDDQHTTFMPEQIGRVFYSSVAYEVLNGRAVPRIEMYVEVTCQEGIWLDGRTKLDRGCWRVTMTDLHRAPSYKQVNNLKVEPIGNEDYVAVKRNVASMLSLESYAPPSARW